MKVVGYLRVSTIEQAEHGFGLDSQRAAVRAAATAGGHRVVAWCSDEGISGAKPAADRPGLTDALEMIRDGKAQGIVVRDLDRLAREITVQEAVLAAVWQTADAVVLTSSGPVQPDDPDDPMRRVLRLMVGVFADLERSMIAKRLRDGRRAKKAKGGWAAGREPYGFASVPPKERAADNLHGALVPVADQQAALDRILDLHTHGASLRSIAAALTEEGHPTSGGGRCQPTTVARIIARNTTAA
ncbi:recombinase family protein [Tsukamurella soli]|uniref:Recombinase family protein n=1 Tax=Tsukamurella soli TaxID=644556 RepID=A0ABP8KJB0_9ACTN